MDNRRQAFTASEVAELFGVSLATVYREAQFGSDLGAFRVRGRVLFPRSTVLRLLRMFDESEESAPDSMPASEGRPVAA